jgi:hypothetical protein
LVCHENPNFKVPNPFGDDWIRKNVQLHVKIANKTKEWSDHLLCICYDWEMLAKDGKNTSGGNTRTIYPTEQSTCVAKSRSLKDPIPYTEGDDELWRQLFPELYPAQK